MKFREIKRLIRISPLRNSRIYHALRFEIKKRGCGKVIDSFMGGDIEPGRKRAIINNMRRTMIRYHWDFDEYFLFNYESLSHEERLGFVPEYDKNVF